MLFYDTLHAGAGVARQQGAGYDDGASGSTRLTTALCEQGRKAEFASEPLQGIRCYPKGDVREVRSLTK